LSEPTREEFVDLAKELAAHSLDYLKGESNDAIIDAVRRKIKLLRVEGIDKCTFAAIYLFETADPRGATKDDLKKILGVKPAQI